MIFIFGPLLCLVCVGNMTWAAYCDLFLYANNSYLVYQQKDVRKIEQNRSKKFYYICDWFLDNELSIRIGDNKRKKILNGNKHKLYKVCGLDIRYDAVHVKQCEAVTHIGCSSVEYVSRESMALKVIDKIKLSV